MKSTHYPKHQHFTHLIPPIKEREKGVKTIPKEELVIVDGVVVSSSTPILMSDGHRDFSADGTIKTSFPYYTHKKWVDKGKKKGLRG